MSTRPNSALFNPNILSLTPGIKYYKPSDFFSGKHVFGEIPELAQINTHTNELIRKIAWYLESQGVAIGLGTNSNRSSFFNLYDPSATDLALQVPPIKYGLSDSTSAGKLNFLTHDPMHLYIGTVYIPYKDILDSHGNVDPKKKLAAKEKLTRVLLENEALVTAFTFGHHLKWYWNWVNANKDNKNQDIFENLNRGVASFAMISNKDYYALMSAHIRGEIMTWAKIMKPLLNFEYYRNVRETGVPIFFPDFSKYHTRRGEKFFMKYGFSTFLALATHFSPKGGFKDLLNYSIMQAEFYTSDWFLEWANRFKIGVSVDIYAENFKKKVEDFCSNRLMSEIEKPPESQFEAMQIKNALSQLGRKLIELKHVAFKTPDVFNQQEILELEENIATTAAQSKNINKLIKSGRIFLPIELQFHREALVELMQKLNKRFPTEKYLPTKLRLAHADYSFFWFDSTAVVMPRPNQMVNNPSNKSIWESALKQRQAKTHDGMKTESNLKSSEKPIDSIDAWVKKVAAIYNQQRRGAILFEFKNEECDYLENIEHFRKSLEAQMSIVFNQQILEFDQLTHEQRVYIFEMVEQLVSAMNKRIFTLIEDYRTVFNDNLRTNSDIQNRLKKSEMLIRDSSHEILNENLMPILVKLSTGKSYREIENHVLKLQTLSNSLMQFDAELSAKRQIIDFKNIVTHFASTISKISQKFTSHASPVEIEFQNMVTKKGLNLPKNAVIIFMIAQDSSLPEFHFLPQLLEKLEVTKSLLVTKVDDFSLAEQNITNLIHSNSEKLAITFFPEEGTPNLSAQMPLITKPRAFALARSISVALRGKRLLFLVQVRSNLLEHLTCKKRTKLKIEISDAMLVPSHKIGIDDSWVNESRKKFERFANLYRGKKQIDLIEPTILKKSSQIYAANTINSYNSVSTIMTSLDALVATQAQSSRPH